MLHQHTKKLNICIPGLIISYNETTKRAVVRIALNIKLTTGETIDYPLVSDVPIVMPSTQNYCINFKIKANDSLVLLFSQRGLSNFKKAYAKSDPSKNAFFSLTNAIGILGFGNIATTSVGNISMQDTKAKNYITIKDDEIEINYGKNNIVIDDTQIKATVSSSELTLTSSKLTADISGSTLELSDSEFKVSVGGSANIRLTQAAFISSVPISAPSFSGGGGGDFATASPALMTAGIDMKGNNIKDVGEIEANGVNLTTHTHIDSKQGTTSKPQ